MVKIINGRIFTNKKLDGSVWVCFLLLFDFFLSVFEKYEVILPKLFSIFLIIGFLSFETYHWTSMFVVCKG